MRKRILLMLGIMAFVMVTALVAAPRVSQAVLITSVSVTVRTTTWCQVGGGCANPLWNLGAGVNIVNGQTLTLGQTGSFNFDTSEPGGVGCSAANPCNTTLVINGTTVLNNVVGGNALNNFNNDPNPADGAHNEAANYASSGGTLPTGVSAVLLGYFDNVHSGLCTDTSGSGTLGNCMPDPVFASATNTLIGAGTNQPVPGIPETNPNHCPNSGSATCWDSGIIQIVTAPTVTGAEPSTLILLGTGLAGLAAWARRRQKNN